MSPSHDFETSNEEPDESFWQLVDAALDDRRDPLTDPAVARRLAEDPRSRVAYERLERSLRAVARTHAPSPEARLPGAEIPAATSTLARPGLESSAVTPHSDEEAPSLAGSATEVLPFDGARVPTPTRHWGLRVASVAAVVVVTLAWIRTPQAVTPVEVVAIRASSTRAPAQGDETSPVVSRVHTLRVDVVDERPGSRVTTRFDGERRRRTVEHQTGSHDTRAGDFVVRRSTTTTSELSGSPAREYHR